MDRLDALLQENLLTQTAEQLGAYQGNEAFLQGLPATVNPYCAMGVFFVRNFALAAAAAAGDSDTWHTDAPVDWFHVFLATNSGTPDFGVCLGSQYNATNEMRLLSTFSRRLTIPARMNEISLRNYSANANTITVLAYTNEYRGLETAS